MTLFNTLKYVTITLFLEHKLSTEDVNPNDQYYRDNYQYQREYIVDLKKIKKDWKM